MIDALERLGLIDDADIALDEAALTLAALDRPDRDIAPYQVRIAALTTRLAGPAVEARGAAAQARLLQRVIAVEQGFRGDSRTYDDPANADLIQLFERRRGMPVTLSILYAALARRLGWAADPLNVPGHVLVRIGRGADTVIVDPFDDGRTVDAAGLEALLARVLGHHAAPEPAHVKPMSNRAVLVRLLTNQATRARRAGDMARALTLHRRMTSLAPGFTGLWWERARLEQLLGHYGEARTSLLAMLETTRAPAVTQRIKTALAALARLTH